VCDIRGRERRCEFSLQNSGVEYCGEVVVEHPIYFSLRETRKRVTARRSYMNAGAKSLVYCGG
jgi:hypothetical protein